MKEWIEISELERLLDLALTLRNVDGKFKDFIVNDIIEANCESHETHGLGKMLILDEALKVKNNENEEVKNGVENIKHLIDDKNFSKRLSEEIKQSIINDIMEAELGGKEKVGLARMLLLDEELKNRESNVELVKEFGNYALYNGHKELGHIAALTCVEKVIELAKSHGTGIVALNNSSRYGRLKPFARKIAENNLIGIIMNNAGPAAVTAYGGITPILGTNPICFGFPGKDEPYLFDFSTSKAVWGEIRQAKLENRELPEDCFLDKEGSFTRNPDEVEAVIPFGDTKGFALCYAVELLAGAFTGAKMGLQVETEYDLGFLFMAFSPEIFGDLEEFKDKLKVLENEIKSSVQNAETEKIYIPGEVSKEKVKENLSKGKILVEKDILDRIRKMAVSLDGGIESNNKMN